MTYELAIGDRAYSSWSMRAGLLFDHFDIPCTNSLLDFAGASVGDQLAGWGAARTVPALRLPGGTVIADSMAIAEELASRHPGLELWPGDADARATARALAAEMHSGFGALRSDCPMNLRSGYVDFAPSDAVLADVARIDAIWSEAREKHGQRGPWLCGAYSIADAFYAPVAARIAGHSLTVGPVAAAYVDAHLKHGAFRRWRAMGCVRGQHLPWYDRAATPGPWPGPAPIPAMAIETGTPENAACPYSGKPVAHLMQIESRTFGFCNAFCRDKTVADPEAWDRFMDIYRS